MSDVVGTAYVRIKALTNDLSKQIKSGIEKGMKDANLERIYEKEGDAAGEAYADKVADSASKTFKKRASDLVPGDQINDEFEDVFASVRKQVQRLDLDEEFSDQFVSVRRQFERFDIAEPFRESFERSIKEGTESSRRIGSILSGLKGDIRDAFDVDDLPFFEETEGRFKRLAREIRDGDLGDALTSLENRFKSFGQTSGLHIGFIGKSLTTIGLAIVAALPFIQDAGAAILAYATGLVAQIGFLVTALSGLGIAAAAAIGSAAAVALPIVLAFKSETEFLLDFKDSIAATGEEFLRIGTATQQTLLPALDEAFFILGDLIPMFSEFGFFAGEAAGHFSLLASGVLVSEEAQGRFQAILQSSLRIFDLLIPTLINIGDILSGIWVAALPSAERFTRILGDMVQRWTDLVNVNLQSGELTNTFDVWFERARVLGSALGNLSGALFDILNVGANASDNVFVRFDEWAERFRAFTESQAGQNKLALIFENSLAVMREINAIAADLFDGIFGRLADVGGVDNMVAALQRFRDVIPEIQAFWANALETIDRVVRLFASNIWEKITQAWEEMADPLGRLGEQILNIAAVMNESGAFDVFLDLMKILADTLATLLAIPGFGQFIAYMVAFNAAMKISTLLLGPFVRGFGSLIGLIKTLLTFKAGIALAETATGLTRLAAGFRAVSAANAAKAAADVASGAASTAAGAGKLSGTIATALTGASRLGIALPIVGTALAVGGAAFFLHQQRVQRWNQEIRQATDALGLLNDGLNITAEGVAKYVTEFSRFESNEQLDDLGRLGISVSELSKGVAEGTLSYVEFADAALAAGEVQVQAVNRSSVTRRAFEVQADTLAGLQEQYNLTNDQLIDLAKGQEVYVGGTQLMLEGNDSLLESFEEVNKVIGAAAKDSIDEFVTNATNMELLTDDALANIKQKIDDASDEDAAQIMVQAQKDLQAAAAKQIPTFNTLSDATRNQIREQATLADGTIDNVKQYELLRDALAKQNTQIRNNLALFESEDFEREFGAARDAVLIFQQTLSDASISGDLVKVDTDNLDTLVRKLPEVGFAAQNLFTQLSQLPEEEFNAAATAMGIDSDNLRAAMDGANQAIVDLQNQALESLPSVGELLDKATETQEDGTQFFDTEGFISSVNERIADTKEFAANIKAIQKSAGDEAARLAAQQGPEAAAGLAKLAAADPAALQTALQGLEDAEKALTDQIEHDLGPGIALEYAKAAGLIGKSFNGGLAGGLSDPATLKALENAGIGILNSLENTFQGVFKVNEETGEISFTWTGKRRFQRPTGDAGRFGLSEGGFVGASLFNFPFPAGPKGTDTVPAWLTPGEFVLRRTVAQAIPARVLNALNAGDPRMMALLTTTLTKNRVDNANGLVVAGVAAGPVANQGSPLIIQQMTVQAPTPLEAARQTAQRLAILQTQLTRR